MSSGVSFEEDNMNYSRPAAGPSFSGGANFAGQQSFSGGSSGMSRFLMKHGIVKSENGAQVVLIAVFIINMIITAAIIMYVL